MTEQRVPPAGESTAHLGDDYLAELAARSSLEPEDEAAVAALPVGSALLIVRRGPNAGARFLLDVDEVIAGRHPEAGVFLDDVTVSRRHAAFLRTGEGFAVADLGSLNGTYHNGELIEAVPLADGDEVQVGKFRLVFFSAQPGGRA